MAVKFKYVEKQDFIAIQIEEGPYKGIVLQFGRVMFTEPREDGTRSMKFEHKVLLNPNDVALDNEFVDTAGDILVKCIEEKIESEEVVYANGTN